MPDGYACSDLKWDSKRYQAALKVLVEEGLIRFDPENQVVLIERWFQHNPPMNESHLLGIERELERCASEVLQDYCYDELNAFWEAKMQEKAKKEEGKKSSGDYECFQPRNRTWRWSS